MDNSRLKFSETVVRKSRNLKRCDIRVTAEFASDFCSQIEFARERIRQLPWPFPSDGVVGIQQTVSRRRRPWNKAPKNSEPNSRVEDHFQFPFATLTASATSQLRQISVTSNGKHGG